MKSIEEERRGKERGGKERRGDGRRGEERQAKEKKGRERKLSFLTSRWLYQRVYLACLPAGGFDRFLLLPIK
jgi:hypothetical protein